YSIDKPLGKVLLEAGLISISQIELALQEQTKSQLRIGEIFVEHGWIKQQTVDFFADSLPRIAARKENKKPLIYFLQAAALLNKKQINSLLELQKNKPKKARFHHLVVEQGYLKQATIDFFLAHIFKIYNPQVISAINSYDVLRSYTEGKKDFSSIDLSSVLLRNLSLRGIVLNGSNLAKSDLSKTNLSNSSLVGVNLTQANLTKAILTQVDFTKSFLNEANFQAAHLENANFSSAMLQGVNFQFAYLAQANFSAADLTQAKLLLNYSYEVYYNQDTIFDSNFNPRLAGWTSKDGLEFIS
ncbi:MAG: pentapeptide repeat-containing protein, partial [Cyanobacteria bacterium J06600_6]